MTGRIENAVRDVERHWVWALAGLLLLAGGLWMFMGRGLSFRYDDWNFVVNDYGGGVHSLLKAHVGNISIFPIGDYKILFHLVGLDHYAVFRLQVVVLHLICGVLIFVLAARRIPHAPALLAAALILFLGAAWEDLLWGFQVGYLMSVTGGLATWVLLERSGRWNDIAAMLCLLVAAGSSSLGIAIMVGVAVELAWRGQGRRGWIVAVPAVLYALWYLGYGESQVTFNSLVNAPGYAADLAAAAFGGLVGRGLEWGRPIAVVAVLVLLRRLTRPLPVSPRLAGLLATGIALWVVTAVARSTISPPESSRYIYLGAIVIVLTGVELLQDVTITPRLTALAAPLVGYCAITGFTLLHIGADSFREWSNVVTAELGALELAAGYAPPEYQLDPVRAPDIFAGRYLHTVRAIGSSPADSPAKMLEADAEARAAADTVLLRLEAPGLRPLGNTQLSPLTPPPAITSLTLATQSRHAECVQLTPVDGGHMSSTLTLPRSGVLIRNEGADTVTLALKRFGESFVQLTSVVDPHSQGVLSPFPDSATARVPWQLQLSSASRISVCGLAG